MIEVTVRKLREKARLRQRMHRERQRDEKHRAAIADAERIELLNEEIAPAINRQSVMLATVNGEPVRMIRGPRVSVIAGRQTMSLDPMLLRSLTRAHIDAARRLQADWDEVGVGLGLSAVDYTRSGGVSGVGPRGHGAMLAQIATRKSLEAALDHVFLYLPSIIRVVLARVPLSVWADEARYTVPEALAILIAALDCLAAHYEPVPRDRAPRLRTIGPRRQDYTLKLVAEEI